MRVLLVDDHPLFRSGLKFLLADLEASAEFDEVGSVDEARQLPADPVDLILLDLHLRGLSGVPAVEAMRDAFPDAVLVVLSSDEAPALVRQSIDAGATGFIPKSSTPPVLISALRLVLAGGTYLPLQALADLDAPRAGDGGSAALASARATLPACPAVDPAHVRAATTAAGTEHRAIVAGRQRDVLLLAIQGKSNKRIARALGISEGTVKQHLSAAYRSLGVANRTEAVYVAAALGLTPTQGPLDGA